MHLNHRYSNDLSEIAAGRLLEKLEMSDGKCTFLCSGSEAVSFSLKAARIMTGRSKFITLKDSYLAAYGEGAEKEDHGWILFDWKECAACSPVKACADTCNRFAKIPFEALAGFVFEPGSASGSVQYPPEKPVHAICTAIKQMEGLVVANEVTTGIGRTGRWFGFQHYDIHPDLVAVGKGLGNGYPVSAVALWND
jgi:acetylornithine aminotransferase